MEQTLVHIEDFYGKSPKQDPEIQFRIFHSDGCSVVHDKVTLTREILEPYLIIPMHHRFHKEDSDTYRILFLEGKEGINWDYNIDTKRLMDDYRKYFGKKYGHKPEDIQ
jgi:hypothetical protein